MATADVGSIVSSFLIKDLDTQLEMLKQVEKQIKDLEGRKVKLQVDAGGVQEAERGVSGLTQSISRIQQGGQQLQRGLQQAFGGIAQPFKDLHGFIQGAQRSVFRLGDSLVHIGQIGAATAFRLELLLAPFQAAIAATAGQVLDLEHALELVVTQTDLVGGAAQDFRDRAGAAIRDVTNQWAVGSDDMANALYNLISSLNISNDAALALLPTIAKFAVAGDASADEVSQMATVLLASYVPNLDDANVVTQKLEQFLTQVFTSMKQGRGTFQDYVQQIGDFVRISQEAGASLPDVLALFAALTRTRPISVAATQIARLSQTIITPRFREAAVELGVAVDQFAQGQEDVGYYTARANLVTKTQQEQLVDLQAQLENVNADIAIQNQRIAEWTDKTKESTKMTQQDRLNELLDKRKMILSQLNPLLAKASDQTQVFINTGTKEARPAFDILQDIFDTVRKLPRPQALESMAELFPRIRAELGALEFEKLTDEILGADGFAAALASITEITPEVESSMERMNKTGKNALVRLGNTVRNFGMLVYEDLQERFKGAIDLMIEGFIRLQDMSPQLRQRLANLFIALSALPFVLLATATAIMGAGGLVAAIGTLLSPNLLAVGLGLFTAFREEIEKLRDIVGDYDLTSLNGIASFIGDLAVALGLINAQEVGHIFDKLGILAEVSPTNVMAFKDAIGGITDKIQSGVSFVKDWVDAIGGFLDMVENREGIVGGLVAQLEKIFSFLGGEAGKIDLGLDTTEARSNLIDKIAGAIIGWEIAKMIWNVVGGVVNVVGGVVNLGGGLLDLTRNLKPGFPTGGGPMTPIPGVPGPAGTGLLDTIIATLLSTGAANIIPPAILARYASQDKTYQEIRRRESTSLFDEFQRLLQENYNQMMTGVETTRGPFGILPPVTQAAIGPMFKPLTSEFLDLKTTDERRNEILEEIRQLLEIQNKDVFTEDMYKDAAASTAAEVGKIFDESKFADAPVTLQRNIQNVFDRLTSNVPELGLPTLFSSPFLPRDFATFGMPRTFIPELGLPTLGPRNLPETGRGISIGDPELSRRFLDVFDRLVTEGVAIKTEDVQNLIAEFARTAEDPTRQTEIITELQAFLDEDKTNRFDFLMRLEQTLNQFAASIASMWPRMVPQNVPGYRAVPFHSGGYLNVLANEFIASPLTTRLLENVMGGRLTQSSMRQFAFAQVGMMPQQVNHVVTVAPGGGLTIDLQAHGMGDFKLTTQQQDQLSWEVTAFVAEKLRRSFGDNS